MKTLKEDAVSTLFPVVEAMLMPSIRRTQAATGEFREHSLETLARNSGDLSLRAQRA